MSKTIRKIYLIVTIGSVSETVKSVSPEVVQSMRKSHSKFRFKMSKSYAKLLGLRSRMFNDFSEALGSSFYCSVLCPMKLSS